MSRHDDAAASTRVRRIEAIVLRSKDPEALAAYYRAAFDFVDEPSMAAPDGAEAAGIEPRSLVLGGTHLRIEPSGIDGASYPDDVPGWSPLFQHFAMRVSDIDAAMRRLARIGGCRPISLDGPERLPPNTGSVVAFKFRDPEGHPLEFLAFPDQRSGPLFAGIDHSAISVADMERSIAFYEGLGFVVGGRSLNSGVEQARLDGIEEATVDVVALRMPSGAAPHLELLAYRGDHDRGRVRLAAADDVSATCLSLEVERQDIEASSMRDPDGHRLGFRTKR